MKGKQLVISECLIKALAFDTKKTELEIYGAVLERVNELLSTIKFGKQSEIRRHLSLKGSMVKAVVRFTSNTITIVPLRNKSLMAQDHNKFMADVETSFGPTDEYVKMLERKLLLSK